MQTWPQPVKLTLTGPMFRYDRPQAGRYREFWQFDVEAIGDPGPAVDAELIELGSRFYAEAGVAGVKVLLNSIGDGVCRPAYIEELKAYFRPHAAALPEVERGRLEKNPLRLLDSKDPAMAALNAAAPRITDRLCDACRGHFEAVQAHLAALEHGGLLEQRRLDRPVAVAGREIGGDALEPDHRRPLGRQEVAGPPGGTEGGHRRKSRTAPRRIGAARPRSHRTGRRGLPGPGRPTDDVARGCPSGGPTDRAGRATRPWTDGSGRVCSSDGPIRTDPAGGASAVGRFARLTAHRAGSARVAAHLARRYDGGSSRDPKRERRA
jgi:hypothetical protein